MYTILFLLIASAFCVLGSSDVIELEELKRMLQKQGKSVSHAGKNVASASLTIPWTYPLYKQCDNAWGNDMMGNKTVCAVGCLMSSTSSGLAGTGIQIESATASPGTLNAWLKANEGYDNNSFIESVLPTLDPARISWPADGMHATNDLPYSTVCDYILKGRIVIGNVHVSN
jgi:hypothetical protein